MRPEQLEELMGRYGYDLVTLMHHLRDSGPPTVDAPELAARWLERTLTEVGQERQRLAVMYSAYSDLRVKHIAALTTLHRAQGVVGKAAVRHRDEALARLARDELHGMTKEDARVAIPKPGTIFKAWEAQDAS